MAQIWSEISALVAQFSCAFNTSTLTNVCETIADLPSGQKIADAMIAAWIETYKNQEAVAQDDDFPLRQKLHPSIQAEFATKKAQAQARISVFEVCKQVAEHRSWGARHKVAMLNSTAQDFEQLIKNLPTSDLQLLLSQMIEFLTNRSTYGHEFDVGASQFAIACQNIVNMPDSGRLGSLLRSLFEGASISDLLVPIDASHDLDEDEG